MHERPSGAFRLPGQRDGEYAVPSPYVTPNGGNSTGSHSRAASEEAPDQVRVPVRGPEYPTIRPNGGATSLADIAPAATYGGSTPASGSVASYGNTTAPVSSVPTPTYGGSTSPVSSVPTTAYGGGTTPAASTSAPTDGEAADYDEPTSAVPPISRFAADGKPDDSVYRSRRPISALVVGAGTALLMIPVLLLLVRATFVDDAAASGIVPAVLLALGLPLTGIGLFALAGGGPAGREGWLRPPAAYLPVGLLLLLAAGLAVA